MATPAKPFRTGSAQTLSFDKLAPGEFERLCLWLVREEKFDRVEHLGEGGGESGRDVVGWKNGRRWVFQCKRVRAFSTAEGKREIAKLRSLPVEQQPHELVFVVSRTVGVATREALRKEWRDEATCHFWSGNELDEKVKKYPRLLDEFFQLPPERTRNSFPINLPFASLGEFFQGREDVLATLRKKLIEKKAGQAMAIAGKAIHGLGGVGKSRLAIEYGWRYAGEYSAVFFVGAGSPADLRRNLAALSKVLDLPEREATDEEIQGEAVLRRLAEQPGWLLILDNVDTKEAAVAVDALVPRLHGGDVLLTGRLARWGAEVEPIELDVLAEEAAVAFLLARTEGRRRKTKEDALWARDLAREVGCLPLALEQAGAYIAERKLTFEGYRKEWHSQHEQVLTWFDPRVSHYPASIAITWQTSVAQLTAPARRLLERLAWLGPEPIPESLLDVPVPDLSEPEQNPHDALVDLATYSLVTRADETPTFTAHRLVQDATRRSLRDVPGNEALNDALRWVNAAFGGNAQDVRTWPTLDPLSPHARAVVAYADSAGIAEPTARLINELGCLYFSKALPTEAEPLMRRALAIDEANLGADHPNIARDLNNLATLLWARNRLTEAESLMLRALAIDEASLGADHPSVAIRLNNLAQLLQTTNRLTEAEPLMRRALAIDEATLGADHPIVAIRLNNLATLFWVTNRLTEAEPLMLRALAIDEASLGADHPNVATRLNNLAQLLQTTNRLTEAELLMLRALAIDEARFGADHPNVAIRLNNLAALLQNTNRLAEAEPLMRRALAIDEASFGKDHPNVAIRLNNLALLLQATNRLAEAEPLMRRGLAIALDFERQTGFEHPRRQLRSDSYRNLLREMGKSDAEINTAFATLAIQPPS